MYASVEVRALRSHGDTYRFDIPDFVVVGAVDAASGAPSIFRFSSDGGRSRLPSDTDLSRLDCDAFF